MKKGKADSPIHGRDAAYNGLSAWLIESKTGVRHMLNSIKNVSKIASLIGLPLCSTYFAPSELTALASTAIRTGVDFLSEGTAD